MRESPESLSTQRRAKFHRCQGERNVVFPKPQGSVQASLERTPCRLRVVRMRFDRAFRELRVALRAGEVSRRTLERRNLTHARADREASVANITRERAAAQLYR